MNQRHCQIVAAFENVNFFRRYYCHRCDGVAAVVAKNKMIVFEIFHFVISPLLDKFEPNIFVFGDVLGALAAAREKAGVAINEVPLIGTFFFAEVGVHVPF